MLVVDHVTFGFESSAVLCDVSLRCKQRQIVGIVGRSGVGKSTLLNLISAELTLRSGTVTINGLSPHAAAAAQRIGYVFQSATLLPWLTVFENVALPLTLHSGRCSRDLGSRAQVEARIRDALQRMHLAAVANRFPRELSGGMQTRVALARAMVFQPQLLLLDEPFAAIDDLVKESLYQDLQAAVISSAACSVLVTHNLLEAAYLCDTVYVLGRRENGSTIVHCETIDLPHPRDIAALTNPAVLAAREHLRLALVGN